MAEADQLALDASVAPAGILAGHLQHKGPDRWWDGWSAWLSVRVGPASGNEVGVPPQQGSGRDQSQVAQWGGQQPAERAEHRPVGPGQCWSGVGAAQYGDLVAQHEDFDVL